MSTQVRIELNGPGIRSLLSSPEVRAMLEEKGQAVAKVARSHAPDVEGVPGTEPLPIDVTPAHSSGRARVLVGIDHPSGLEVEAKHRLLAGSLDAAR